MSNIEGKRAVELDLKCMPVHASTTPSISPCASFSWPGAVYFSISGALSKQGPHPYSPTSNSSAYLPPTLKKKKPLPVFPAAHTYIHKHVFMEAKVLGQKGAGDKNHLEFKAEDCGSLAAGWTVSQPHMLSNHTAVTHKSADRSGGFRGWEQMCEPGSSSAQDLESGCVIQKQ